MTRTLTLTSKFLIPATVVALLGTVLSGCHDAAAGLMKHQTSFVLALLDVSGTTNTARESYLLDLTSIMDQLQSGDSLWADQITENSLATSRVSLKLDLPTFDMLSENRDEYNIQLTELRRKARATAEALMNGKTQKTTILDSLLVAQKVFHGARASTASNRVLVLFSDMREDSDRYVFDREVLTAFRSKQIVAREQADHRIADLKGVRIYVAGATADRNGNPEQIRRVQAFWQAYFQAAGTELADEHYAASLLDFALPGSAPR
jgi:hypothetical protein